MSNPLIARVQALAVGAVVLLAAVLLAGCAGTAGGSASSGSVAGKASAAAVASVLAPTSPTTTLPTITVAKLPPEAVTTLELIASDGPYPYSRDGVTFENRERILPKQPTGYYREYTVKTPGESDRGARRIVTGEDGSRFYTADHYDSFKEVIAQ
ncbi:MAG: ribonuclease [Actinomycetota bacterium]|nr:ribonuclease [Actinomycetota bacterium]